MHKMTTMVLVVAGAALATTGTSRAQDAQESTTHGSIVLPVGDKVHGFLRGGETHVLEVHLAKGDVYSFSVAAKGPNNLLVMNLTLRDPSGHEMNTDAHVKHLAGGKRITVGPFRAAASGTYTIELLGDSSREGDYYGKSKLIGARKTRFTLPSDGTVVYVPVAAGSSFRLKTKSKFSHLSMALPGAVAVQFDANDPLVASLQAGRLASSASGEYRFASPSGLDRATIEVSKPRWSSATVEFPPLPDDPSRRAHFEWLLEWKPQPQAVQDPSTPVTTPWADTAKAIPADNGSVTRATPPTLFVNSGFDAATSAIVGGLVPIVTPPADPVVSDPSAPTPPVPPVVFAPPPAPPVTPPAATPPITTQISPWISSIYGHPTLPSFSGSQSIGRSAYLLDSAAGTPEWRNSPWTTAPLGYPKEVYSNLLPITDTRISEAKTERGDDSDPFVRRTFTNAPKFGLYAVGNDAGPAAVITTTARYYVDGHQVADLLADGGDVRIEWTVTGTGHTDSKVEWTIDGSWTMLMHTSAGGATPSSLLNGQETFSAGTLKESITAKDLSVSETQLAGKGHFDVVGTIVNTLVAPDAQLSQTETRTLLPLSLDAYGNPTKGIDVGITTDMRGAEVVNTVHSDFKGAFYYSSH